VTARTRHLLRLLIASDERRPFTLAELRPVHEYVAHIAGREYSRDPTWRQNRENGLRAAGWHHAANQDRAAGAWGVTAGPA